MSTRRNISARTAGYIRSLVKKGDKYITALIKHARAIRDGSGERVIERLIKSEIEGKSNKTSTVIETLVCDEKKMDIFTNGKIQFSKSIYEDKHYNKILVEIKNTFQKYYGEKNGSE
ncbi:hypothetical protein [Facilibium subflavum]|uniref:hypothetical protein n=1 Tax=Facilibium subflavum TaxID=2219058 RepID=UPI000E64E89A|nr:hypothetical protein [Facilibium subflavum]